MNQLTELVFILDRSGSMSGFEADTVGGFNAAIAKQKEGEGDVLVTTILFDNDSTVIHDRVPLDTIEPMTVGDFRVGGCTALLDALGETIRHIADIHKYARPEDRPAHTVFLITTDGMENASRRYDSAAVKKMIRQKTEENGWEFLFLAANIDAVETASAIGIRPERAANFRQTKRGFGACFSAMAKAVSCVRDESSLCDFDLQKEVSDADN